MTKRSISPSVRQYCFERDNYTCQFPGCTLSKNNGDIVQLHHVLPEQFGGTETPENLITLCDIHHKYHHAEFHAYYGDSRAVLKKMMHLTRKSLSRLRKFFNVDDGYDLDVYLHYLTGHKDFRPGQLQVIRAALAGKNVLFVTPTGSGKSVCYQLPGLLGKYPTLVISPLKALMKDQVESIWSKKIPTTYINSDLAKPEKQRRFDFIGEGLYKFIFVAPERFESKDLNNIFLYYDYSHFVVDEAHEIEMWGMAFRPSYRKLGEIRADMGFPPVIALTATASKETQQKILESLKIPDAEVIVTGFYRDNIDISIIRNDSLYPKMKQVFTKAQYVLSVIQKNPTDKILVFVLTIKQGTELLSYLRKNGVESEFFHSRLETKEKMRIQNRFSGIEKPNLKVLICTSAFGMGINVSDIRHVIHYYPALNLTDYTQQIGRAGRDQKPSFAHLLYDKSDESLLNYMAELPLQNPRFQEKHNYSDEDMINVRDKLQTQVKHMIDFCNLPAGKEWEYILNYFGEIPQSNWQHNKIHILDKVFIVIAVIAIYIVILLLKSVF